MAVSQKGWRPWQGAATHGCGQPGPGGADASAGTQLHPETPSMRQSLSRAHGPVAGRGGGVCAEDVPREHPSAAQASRTIAVDDR